MPFHRSASTCRGARAPGAIAIAALLCGAIDATAQPRRVVTLQALGDYPVFYHGGEVLIRADAEADQVLTYLVDGERRLLTLDVAPPPEGTREHLAIIGTFYDVGRLDPADPRVVGYPFERIARTLFNKPWPGSGELPVLIASSAQPAPELDTTTLRTIALEPAAFAGQEVTVVGRFRGRNLYGDLPVSPGESRWDFVLTSADAALWVVGKEPKGRGFELDVRARVDTGRWLEVTGTVRYEKGMAVIAPRTIVPAETPDTPPAVPVTSTEPRRGPPPEVIFSAPLPDDATVPTDTVVRVQFSRDMDAGSFEGRVAVSYLGAGADSPADEPAMPLDLRYQPRNRVLEIRFGSELDRFRTVTVDLDEGITATDGAPLPRWRLSFFVGG